MDIIFMSSENNKRSDPDRLLLIIKDKIILTRTDKYIALLTLCMYYTWKSISTPTRNKEFQLPDGSYTISDIQGYFEHILKRCGENIVNPSIRRIKNKIENRITFQSKT